MNILTFDIEEWYLDRVLGRESAARTALLDRLLGHILDLLDERSMKGTFFCVGGMTTEFPAVVRRIAARGHEIGCHSMRHTWLNKMSPDEALADTRRAVDALEQCLGEKILSYRAPAFSIGESNPWALDILARCGITRDASVFPAARDFGGWPSFGHRRPVAITTASGAVITEFPIVTARLLGRDVAYSGGGYFRFFPLWYIRRQMARNDYNMCYFHLADLIAETNGLMSREDYEDYFKELGTLPRRLKRYVKSNLGKAGALAKLERLIASTSFINLAQADDAIDWPNTPTIKL